MSQGNKIAVYAAPAARPFSQRIVPTFAPVGASVHDIVLASLPPRLIGAGISALVDINGHRIPRKHWERIRPKPGTIVNVNIVPMGGGGGGKSPLGTILSLAVTIAAPYVGAAFGAATGGWVGSTFIGKTILSGIAQGIFGTVGLMLVNAIAPPPKPSFLGNANNPQESPTQFIEGAANGYMQWGRIPVVLGTRRMFPPKAALDYTETKGNAQYARQLFTWGYGDKIVINNERIGETATKEFRDIQTDNRLSGDLHEGTSLYTNDVFQTNFNVLLSSADGYTTRTTQPDVDEAIVDVTAPQGLFKLAASGQRISQTVEMEVQFRLEGSIGAWSPGVTDFATFSATTQLLPSIYTVSNVPFTYRKDIAVLDNITGEAYILTGTTSENSYGPFTDPALSASEIRLASITSRRAQANGVESIVSITDDRAPTLFSSGTFQSAGDFLVTNTGMTINFAAGGLKSNPLKITSSQSEALRQSVRIRFPARGTYDVQIKRITADTADDQVFDEFYFTALKSITYQQPVRLEGVNGTAMLILGTDQLNGSVDQYNADVSNCILDYDIDTETWVEGVVTSNPAALYRYVLQGGPNALPLSDGEILIEDLEDWYIHCEEQGYTYDRIIDFDASVDDNLRDIASAGAASPAILDGKRTIVIDRAGKDIVQIVTPRNSWGYSGEMIYPELPHAYRVQFPNKDKGYQQDERIVYDDGYNESNATKFEVLELLSCTNADLAFKTARRHIATARLRPEKHTFTMGIDNINFIRGSRIVFEHDVPIIGVGDARVKEVIMNAESPSLVSAIEIDDTITIPSTSNFFVRVRLQDGSFLYKQISNGIGPTKTLNFTEPFARPGEADSPSIVLLNKGDLLIVAEAGGELDLVVSKIDPQDDFTARIEAFNYAPEIFDAENTSIPPFESGITTPLEFIRPVAPVLVEAQSGESAMLVNSDGSYIARAIFSLRNDNEGDILVEAKVRRTGDSVFTNPNVLEARPERVIWTGLEDGVNYDIFIYYRRLGASILSPPLEINNYTFIGASGKPDDVEDFKVTIVDSTLLFEWKKNTDIDIDHYKMKYSAVYFGAAWNTAQLLKETIYETRFSTFFLGGTYLIKAVDRLGNESENPAAIITYDPSGLENVVQIYNEAPDWAGVKDNTAKVGSELVLGAAELGVGYYYFADTLDLGETYISTVSAAVTAYGTFVNDVYDMDDLFEVDDIFGSGQNDVFAMDDLFAIDDIFGIGTGAWAVVTEFRITEDDPNNSPDTATWTPWAVLEAGQMTFRAIQFRLALFSYAMNVSPRVTQAFVKIDMPDRIERGNDLECDASTGCVVVYSPYFKADPAVVITIQDGASDDRLEFISKDKTGFTVKVWNVTAGAYVDRILDYVASGYGRVQ